MPKAIKIEKKEANKLHDAVRKLGVINSDYTVGRDVNFVYFPLKSKLNSQEKIELKKLLKKFEGKIISRSLKKRKQLPKNLKEALENKLTKKEKEHFVSSFDTIGNIAVIEIPFALKKKEKLIAETLLKINPQIETVCKISSAHKGKYRVQAIKVIAGKKQKTALYKEYGCKFRIALDKVFFSPRLSQERIRIAKLIKPQENVGVFFAGVGPFAIIFARHSKAKEIVGIELNPAACKNFEENIVANKAHGKVVCIKGDVNSVVPKLFEGAFDRVVMPLPKGGEDFLETAFKAIKTSGGVIHFYQFVPMENKWKEVEKRITKVCKKLKRNFKILCKKEVRSYSPKIVQVVLDIRVR